MKQISQELYDTKQKTRFIDNGDGTVTDTKEKLMWEKTPLGEEFTWEEAMEHKSDVAGYSDWRLPTIHELFSLVDFSKDKGMLIDDVFDIGEDQCWFWSSNAHASDTSSAWTVNFIYGNASYMHKTNSDAVRCVRQI